MNAVLLRPMSFVDPGRLVSVRESSPQGQKDNVANPQNVADWQKPNHSFEKIAAYVPFELTMSLTRGGNPEEVRGNYVTREFFRSSACGKKLIGGGNPANVIGVLPAGLAGAFALGTSYFPALRAMRVDPMQALRYE